LDISNFVQNVKKICKQRDISATAACVASGLSRSFLTDIKNKNVTPKLSSIQKLADYLEVSVSELMGGGPLPETAAEVITPEAFAVARAYDQADDNSRSIVRLALKMDETAPPASDTPKEAM